MISTPTMATTPRKPAKGKKDAPAKRRKADEERHEIPFKMMINPADSEAFAQAAKDAGLPVTVWARAVLRREARRTSTQ